MTDAIAHAATAADAAPAGETARRLLPWLVAVALLMESLDTTILNTAVPTIAAALGVLPLSMKSVLASYTLSLAVCIPISGWMADRFGTRRVFTAAIALFTCASLLCGVSTDIRMLVACRVLQGCGGAMMMPVGRLTMVRTFAKSELMRAMSFVAIPGLIGPLLGPLAGGLIVGYLHWRVIFFVNIPIGIAGLYLIHRHLPDYRGDAPRPLDVTGLVLFGSGITLLSYVLEVFGEHGLPGGTILALFTLALALIAAYAWHASRVRYPLLRLSLLRIRTFRTAVAGGFVTRVGIGGVPFLFPLLYQVGLGYAPAVAGLLMMPQAVAAMSLKFFMPQILGRFGYRTVLLVNTLVIGCLLAGFSFVGAHTPLALVVVVVFCYGLCTSLEYTSMNTLVYAEIGEHDASGASSIASTVQQMAMSFGVACASLLTAYYLPQAERADPAALIHGLHSAFLVLAALTVSSVLWFRALRREDGAAVARGTLPPA